MKNILLCSVLLAIISYLMGAFITWEINPANRKDIGRALGATIWAVFTGLLIIIRK